MQALSGTAKISPPRVQRIVERSRLIDMLDREREKRIVLVLGQAAQGKSTLVASYIKKCNGLSAWINLSREESDPLNLFRLVVQSVQYALENNLSRVLHYTAMDMGPRAETPLYRGWVRALMAGISSPIQIILDGLEHLEPEAPSFHLLQVFFSETSGIRFILLSRTEPPIEIQKLKMRQEATVIDNDQLAFTLEETKTFFREAHDLSLPLDQVEKIHVLTEGWAGGLVLFSEALKKNPRIFQERMLIEESIGEFKREAFHYLGDEIFSLLREDVREFLVKSSVLEVIVPALVKNILETDDAEAILKELSGRNLFVQLLYNEKDGWFFRYHQMFRDFLRTRFESETSREERQRLFAKAGYVYEQAEGYESALDYYIEAKAYREASNVLERIGVELLKSNRVGDLAQRLRRIPDDLIQQSPWLLYYLSMTRRFIGARDNAQTLMDCLRLFEERGDRRGQILSLAFLIEALNLSGYHPVPMEDLIFRAEILLKSLPQDLYAYESAVLWFQVGFGWTVNCANPRKGFWCCKKAYLIAGQCGDINLQGSAMSRAVQALAWLGEFELADELCLELHKLVEASPYPEAKAYHMIALADLSMLRGEIQKAREQIRLAQSAVEKYGLLYWYSIALATDLHVSVYNKELEKAENIANHMMDMALSMGNRMFEGIALFDTAWISYHKGEWLKAKELLERSTRILSSIRSLGLYHYHAAIVIQSLVFHHLDDEGKAVEELQRTIDHFTGLPDYLTLVDAHFAMAHRKRKQGKDDEAISHLKEGFRIAEEKRHYHTALLSREDFADACVLVLEMNVVEAEGYASHLLSKHLSDLADWKLKRLEAHPNGNDLPRVRELKKAIYRSNLPRLRIQCFAHFQVWLGDVPIENEEWKRGQPRNLLKALIARGAWQSSREVLMEDLWPESEPHAAERNFKVTLHRLRKALEPGMDKDFGSLYLHLNANRLCLDRDLCFVDLEDFLTSIENGQKEENKGNLKEALAWYGKAVELYRGDFLEADLFLPWVEAKREAFRRRYIETLSKMASLWEKQGKVKKATDCYQRIVQAEPFMEEAYQKIMLLYAKRGMRNAALRTYGKYKKALKAELNSEPDEVTTAIYRKIAEGPN